MKNSFSFCLQKRVCVELKWTVFFSLLVACRCYLQFQLLLVSARLNQARIAIGRIRAVRHLGDGALDGAVAREAFRLATLTAATGHRAAAGWVARFDWWRRWQGWRADQWVGRVHRVRAEMAKLGFKAAAPNSPQFLIKWPMLEQCCPRRWWFAHFVLFPSFTI